MKKISKIIITCIVFFMMTTAIYATTEILPESKFGIKKVAILGAGVFLVVQILFIAYQKDIALENAKIKEKNNQENLLDVNIINQNNENRIKAGEIKLEKKKQTLDELTKILKEEKNLFSKIPVEKEIETLPDKMSPKKRNIKLKKEVYVEETISKKPIDTRIVSRNEVKIVRERKKRDIGNKKSGETRKKATKEVEKIIKKENKK